MLRNKTSLELRIKELFSLDLRSLALFRITFALLILSDLMVRSTTGLKAHYTDFGVLPRAAFLQQFASPWVVSLHFMSGLWQVQVFLFVLQGLLAMMMLLGYRTRLATFWSWVMMLSLQARNPMVLQAGDYLFRMLLFWGMFLPLNARYSIDSVPNPPSQKLPQKIFSMGIVALFAQIAFIYWFTAAFKLRPASFPIWWGRGTAVYNALNINQFTRAFGYFLLRFPFPILKFLTRAVICFEILGPFLLFFPIHTELIRVIGVLAFWSLHLGFGLSLALGPFPWISSIALVPFIPTFVWEKLFVSLKRSNLFKEKITFDSGITSKVLSLLPKPGGAIRLRLSMPQTVVVTLALIYVLFWNIGTLKPKYGVPKPLKEIGIMFGLEQRWNMFSPPLTDDGWFVIPGILKNGQIVDLFKRGAPLSWEKPVSVSATFKNERWRKYTMNLWLAANAEYRIYYGRYLCRDWNSRHKEEMQLEKFKIYYMRERTLPTLQIAKPEGVVIWSHWCFKVPEEELSRGKKDSSKKKR